jgi:hypothetical protein
MLNYLNRPAHPNAIPRIMVTALVVVLSAAVAVFAPPTFREALDLVAGWTLILSGCVVIGLAVDDATPFLARLVGRNAFKVARAAYRVANR